MKHGQAQSIQSSRINKWDLGRRLLLRLAAPPWQGRAPSRRGRAKRLAGKALYRSEVSNLVTSWADEENLIL